MKIIERLAQIPKGTIATVAGVGYVEGIPARDAPAGTPQGVVRREDGDLIVLDMWGLASGASTKPAFSTPLQETESQVVGATEVPPRTRASTVLTT